MSEFCPPTKLSVSPSKTHRTTAYSSGTRRLFRLCHAPLPAKPPRTNSPAKQGNIGGPFSN